MRPFLYTLDQIATLLQVPEATVRKEYIHYDGWSVGAHRQGMLAARNIAPEGKPTEWRVSDRELARWMAKRGFKVYLRGWVSR
jgi:hypothetical protein